MESKRNSSTKYNPVFIAQSVSKIIKKIQNNRDNNAAEIKLLKEQCINSEDPVVSLTACKGLIMLVKNGILQTYTTLSELVSSLSLAKSYDGIIMAICDLLLLDMEHKINTMGYYECPFNSNTLQHPFILVLNQEPDLWMDILNKLKYFYDTESNSNAFYTNELMYPFYMHVICNPNSEVPEIFQYKLWNFIIRQKEPQSLNIIPYILTWLQFSTKKQTSQGSNHLMDLCTQVNKENNHELNEILILWLTFFLYKSIEHKCDPRDVIIYLQNSVKANKNELCNSTSSTILVLLAECIVISPPVYLSDLLKLCKMLLFLNLSNKFAAQAIRASLLQWLAYDCILTTESSLIARDILVHIENNETYLNNTNQLCLNKTCNFLKNTNQHIYTVIQLNILSESSNSTTLLLDWLEKAEELPPFLLKNMQIYFMSLLLSCHNEPAVILKVITILLKITESYNEFMPQLLILILHAFSNTTNSEIHFAFLKSLPKMAVIKENVPLILNTLNLVHKGKFGSKSFAMSLFFDLWNTDTKYYPNLENLLVYSCNKDEDGPIQFWEFYVTKAFVLKQICLKSPQIYGRELVGHLSEVVNKCTEEDGSLASALALDGITQLCKADIIDVTSTWDQLAPRFVNEVRVIVIKSLCNFMSEFSFLEPSAYNEKLIKDVISNLWNYATNYKDAEIVSAAYKALSCFSIEQVSEHFPDTIKALHPNSASIWSGSTINTLHGNLWLTLLRNSKDSLLDCVGNLLIKFVSKEISEYHSSVYKVEKNHKEPPNYNYLQSYSVVRALGNYIRQEVQNQKDSPKKGLYVLVQCMRILSEEYSKPLPPADWCFLQELIHVPEARSYCINLASRQVQLSGSARRLMENYIMALTELNHDNNDDDIKNVFKNLSSLCNSIQPVILRPFIENSMGIALNNAQNSSNELFVTLLMHIEETLKNENLHEANRFVLSQIIVNTAWQMDVDSELFDKLLNCIIALSIPYIDELSSSKLWKEAPDEKFQKSLKIKSALALPVKDSSSLTSFNDFISITDLHPLQCRYILKTVAQVMQSYRNSSDSVTWIIELLGKIQSTIANENTSKSRLKFLYDIYIASMIILSGQNIFMINIDDLVNSEDHRLQMFPQSVALLMTTVLWKRSVAQISEWLYYMINYESTPQNYRISFYQSLSMLKYENLTISKSMRYLCTKISVNVS